MAFRPTNESTNPQHPDDNTHTAHTIFAAAVVTVTVRQNGTDRKSNVITITQMLFSVRAMCVLYNVHLFLPPDDSGILFLM